MKKLQVIVLTVIACLLLSGQSFAQFEGNAALIVVAADPPTTAETAIITRLEGMGFDVTFETQDLVTDDSIEEMSLLLISATVSSTTAGGNMPGLADYEIPVINWECFLYDLQGFQGTDGGEFNTMEIEIVNEEHPMAAGLDGLVTITNSDRAISYGVPEGDVEVIAVNANPDSAHQAVLFCYDTGAAMLVGDAPARRVGHFLLNDVTDDMTDDGWALFDASVYWAMSYEPVAVEDVNPDIPMNYVLHDNYPNPFNPMTHIVFSTPKQTHIRLSIWNALGEKITTLVNEVTPAGNHPVTFNASDFSSGLYFYKLEAGSQTITKKMLLMK
jgi:hypothetical protein